MEKISQPKEVLANEKEDGKLEEEALNDFIKLFF